MSVNTHIPLRYCLGFAPYREHRYQGQVVIGMGEKVTQEIIDNFPGDSSKYIVAIRPEVNLDTKIKINIDLYERAEEEKLERIISKVSFGEILFEQGDEDRTIYILLSGALQVFMDGAPVAQITERGSFVGEMSILRDEHRSATLQAMTDCTLYKVDGSNLLQLAQDYPVILTKMCRSIAEKIALTSTELSLMKMMSSHEQTRVIYRPVHEDTKFFESVGKYKERILKVSAYQELFHEGDNSYDMFILVKGGVRITIGGETIARIASPGMMIGEMSSVRVKARSATVSTTEDSEFYRIQGLRMMEMATEEPNLMIKLAQVLANRLVATSSEYAHWVKQAE